MNSVLTAMYVVIGILIMVLLILNILSTSRWLRARTTVVISSTDVCTLPTDQLTSINTSNDVCCYDLGEKTGAYVVDRVVDDTPLRLSVISTPTYYANVCREYCSNGYSINVDGTLTCLDSESETTLANKCVKLAQPKFPDGQTCKGPAMPIAVIGVNPLYALHASTAISFAGCSSVGPC